MPTAEIITIGTELLLGEIIDTNTRYLARTLRDQGIDIFRTTTVGDNPQRIAQAIQEAAARTDIIITTGGLGPTVDDPTRQAVAQAVGVDLEFHPELWEQIQERFRRYNRQATENNRRQAYIPAGAHAIENLVGTAPSFWIKYGECLIFALPGVPHEMEFLTENAVLPMLREHFDLHGLIKARVLHSAGIGESQIDDWIGDLEETSNPTVGLAAHSGQVDIRITAKAESEAEANQMIAQIESIIRNRMGEWIYGVDAETLEGTVLSKLQQQDITLFVAEVGTGGALIQRLSNSGKAFAGGELLAELKQPEDLYTYIRQKAQSKPANLVLGLTLIPHDRQQDLYIVMITPDGERQEHRSYGGPPQNAPRWAANITLDLIRKYSEHR